MPASNLPKKRELSLKHDSTCPQCGASAIKSGANIQGKEGLRGSNRLPLDLTHSVAIDNYVCTQCGYTESYITDRRALNRIAKQWQKVMPQSTTSIEGDDMP
ncbi:MAG: hypothetical protein AAFN11_11295 [Chloroflexota bacterium]